MENSENPRYVTGPLYATMLASITTTKPLWQKKNTSVRTRYLDIRPVHAPIHREFSTCCAARRNSPANGQRETESARRKGALSATVDPHQHSQVAVRRSRATPRARPHLLNPSWPHVATVSMSAAAERVCQWWGRYPGRYASSTDIRLSRIPPYPLSAQRTSAARGSNGVPDTLDTKQVITSDRAAVPRVSSWPLTFDDTLPPPPSFSLLNSLNEFPFRPQASPYTPSTSRFLPVNTKKTIREMAIMKPLRARRENSRESAAKTYCVAPVAELRLLRHRENRKQSKYHTRRELCLSREIGGHHCRHARPIVWKGRLRHDHATRDSGNGNPRTVHRHTRRGEHPVA